MTVMEKIYESFIAGELLVKPFPLRLQHHDKISEEMKELVLDIAGDYGREMFRAGFALATAMTEELYTQPDKSPNFFCS
ncbi:MAG: hypothetical protein K2J77_12795 [Oscillospiraceae bacterium]|nr:hypothetical protein [Oscillospiraceae bacterium]